MESRLFQALKAFKGADGCEANLFEEFKKIAEEAFFSGYFLINGGCKDAYRLKLTCIEFYYHEDDGNIKDEKKYLKGKDEFGYALGAVCPNPSGVDVLFDDPQKKYHASFLIRGYKAIVPREKEWENNEKRKNWAPHDFWYDLFGGANMLSNGKFCIEWIDEPDETSGYAEPMQRININDNRLWGFKRVEKAMITEQYKDKVFFSQLLRTDYPNIYKDVCEILDANNVAHETLPLTKDYWCRDYMPIQYACNRFSQFVYNPDYLRGKEKYITDVDKVMKKMVGNKFIVNHSSLVIDGGNIVVGEIEQSNTYTTKSFIVMTDKVMIENEGLSKKEIESKIRDSFKPKECNSTIGEIIIVWLPWDKKDVCGHTDGILRFVGAQKDGKPVVLTNLSVYDDGIATLMRNVLMEHFYVIELNLSEYNDLSWAYINALQTRDVIIVPGIGNTKLDNEAMSHFIALYPDYKGRIYQVQMKVFIEKWGGALNCCSWTISEDMSKLHHDIENDKRYISIIEKYQKDSKSVCIDEIRFLGDYYPKKLENDNRDLDCLYYGF